MNTVRVNRLQALDILRGVLMVIMALDHASFFLARVHFSEYWGRPLPVYPDVLSFLTRFITHLCAPGFCFLMGAGIVLLTTSRRQKGWDERKITSFLMIRGLMLIAVELVIVNLAWGIGVMRGVSGSGASPGGGFSYPIVVIGVLSCLGCSLILCGWLKYLNAWVLTGLSIFLILLSHFSIPSANHVSRLYHPLLRLMLIPGQTGKLLVMYPVLPWLAITIWGVIFGKMLLKDKKQGFRWACVFSLLLLTLFGILRILFGNGDFHPPISHTWIGYFYLTKYPPSIAFISLTVGVNGLLLFGISKIKNLNSVPIKLFDGFGKVPFFFYVLHIAGYALAGAFTLHFRISYPLLYLLWLFSLVLFYPLCLWFGKLKAKAPVGSIIRFF